MTNPSLVGKWIWLTLSIIGTIFIGIITAPLPLLVPLIILFVSGEGTGGPSYLAIIYPIIYVVWSLLLGILPSLTLYKQFGNRKIAVGLLLLWPLINFGIYRLGIWIFTITGLRP